MAVVVDRAPVILPGLLLIRRLGDLAQVRGQLAAYWAILSRHTPGHGPEGFLGIWIDEETLANVPATLASPNPDAPAGTIRVLETAGVSGIWMLCWLDPMAGTLSRADLLSGLVRGAADGEPTAPAPSARFLPVYPHDADVYSAFRDWQALQARHADRVLPPAYLDEAGALCLPPAPRLDEVTRS